MAKASPTVDRSAPHPDLSTPAPATSTTATGLAGDGPAAGRTGRPSPLAFLREFLKAPVELGTCFASSRALSTAMVEGLGLEQARTVIELGPGTGSITRQIMARIPAECHFFVVELNRGLAQELHRRHPDLPLHVEDARNIQAICRAEGVHPGEVDTIVSSLPFLLFPESLQDEILHEAAAVLRPGGRFTMITYRPEGLMRSVQRFRRLMEKHFSQVHLRRRVLQNLPPAYVYWCEK